MTIAQAGADQNVLSSLTIDDAAEALCHNVMFEVAETFADDSLLASYVTETLTIALVNGTVALPSRVLTRFMFMAGLADPADATVANKMRWVKSWPEFIRPLDSTLGYFITIGSSIFMARPGTAYTPGSGMTGSMSLTVPCAYDMPATESATITVPLKVEEQLVLVLAQKLLLGAQRKAA